MQLLLQFLLGTVEKSPDVYLDELQEMLATSCGVYVSRATVWRTLRKAGFTMKKVTHWHTTNAYTYIFLDVPCCGRTLGAGSVRVSRSDRNLQSRSTCLCWRKLRRSSNNLLWPCLVNQRNQSATQGIFCPWSTASKSLVCSGCTDYCKAFQFSPLCRFKMGSCVAA